MEKNKNVAVNVWHGHYIIVASFLFFNCVNLLAFRIKPSKSVNNDNIDTWRWTNHCVSMIHAVIVGLGVLTCFILYPELIYDLFYHVNYCTYLMVAVSTGYFIHDVLDMVVNNKHFAFWEVSVHHLAVISIFIYNLYYREYIGFSCVGLLVEVNSIFLHARKLLQLMKVKNNQTFYRCIVLLNLLTFVVFRFCPVIAIDVSIYIYRDKMTIGYFGMLTICMSIVSLINPILFWRVFKNDIFHHVCVGRNNAVLQNGKNIPCLYFKTN